MNYTDHKVSDHFTDVGKMARHVMNYTMNYTDNQLKAALAKMLPEKVRWNTERWNGLTMVCQDVRNNDPVLDTELLHLCWLVEETLNEIESADYAEFLRPITASYKLLYHASWQQRVIALAKIKGIEI